MKKAILVFLILLSFTKVYTFAQDVKPKEKITPPVTTIKIELTQEEFEKIQKHLLSTNEAVLNSDIPSDKAQKISKKIIVEIQSIFDVLTRKIVKPMEPKKP